MHLAPGMRLGSYEIVGVLGVGGMGEVYRARDNKLRRDVAIKVLPAAFASDPERLARFEREARTLASLNHPGIGAIYGFEHAPLQADGPAIPALILELVDGETLADRIRRGPLSTPVALDIARQIAEALDVAHERGIVHRDLKPANVKITTDDVVKVLDFGLASTLFSDMSGEPGPDPSNSPTLTVAGTAVGVILGTAGYMSPEQARGKRVDKRADIWAFGCMLYEMLTGAQAFRGESVSDTIVAILEREADLSRLPASTPDGIRVLLGRCLEKDVRRRMRDIGDARAEIELALTGPSRTGPVAFLPATERGRRVPWRVGTLLAISLAAAAGAGWLIGQREETVGAPTFDRVVRLVSTPAHEFGPVISPDGKWVAYLSDARGPADVWVKFIAGGDPVNLTASSDVIVQSQDAIGGLAVSPDGSQIAFQGQSTQQLTGASTWVISAPLGGPPRRVLQAGDSGMQWSPDGKRNAYVRTGGPLGDALMVADSEGQNEVEIVKRQGARHLHWIRWDAAGQFLYFNYGFNNFNIEPTEIFRVAASGGPVERVVATARRAVFPFPSPDQRGLFYAANPDSVDLSLWWKDLSSGRAYRVTTGIGEYGSPSVSADGERLVGTVMDVRQSLERATVSFDPPAKLEPLTDRFSGDLDPTWSPGGDRLVFSSSRTGNRTLWIARGDLSQATLLTSGAAFDERPAYSPDGQQIAFVSDRGGRRGIWTISAEAGTPRLITAADVVGAISWSHDGSRLVLCTPVGDAPGLMTVDVASGRTSRVPTPSAANAPAWSPREDLIAYIEPRGGVVGAFLKFVRSTGEIVDVDVSGLPPLSNGFVSWSPDGRRLAAVSLPGAFSGSIWIVGVDGRTPARKLLDLPAGVSLRGLTWNPDGSSVIVGRVQWSGDVFFAERSKRQ